MRKVVLGLGISLDGYIARKNGAVDWLSMDWDYDWTKFFGGVDVMLMGRKTLEHALKMFPSKGKAKNPYQGMETYVFSRSLKESGVDGIELVSGNLKEFVENLKKKEGKNIWLSRGGELAKSFWTKTLWTKFRSASRRICSARDFRFSPNARAKFRFALFRATSANILKKITECSNCFMK